MHPDAIFLQVVAEALVKTVSDNFLDITLGNLITWLVLLIGLITSWVKLKDRVDNVTQSQKDLKEFVEKCSECDRLTHKEEIEKLDKTMEEIKMMGSPSSRTAITVMNSRLDSQSHRLAKVEEAILSFAGIAADVRWIGEWARSQMKK